jgi:hypothetical protein
MFNQTNKISNKSSKQPLAVVSALFKSYDIVKIKNFLALEVLLQIHEQKEDKLDTLHDKALAYYTAKVSAFVENKRLEEGYLDGITEDILLKSTTTANARNLSGMGEAVK